eukprot:XP_001694572.1 hypothetical protein CHLREDRAFT_184146 [Chlamydomonas reinhardtii]
MSTRPGPSTDADRYPGPQRSNRRSRPKAPCYPRAQRPAVAVGALSEPSTVELGRHEHQHMRNQRSGKGKLGKGLFGLMSPGMSDPSPSSTGTLMVNRTDELDFHRMRKPFSRG